MYRLGRLSATILISTYNRGDLLAETLESIRGIRTTRRWSTIVVDNNSSDHTRRVVESRVAGFPVPLHYVFEPRQGKCHALNTGLDRCDGEVVMFTDDDVRVTAGWLDAACEPFEGGVQYTGGPVRPIWGAEPPPWFDRERSDLWGTLAILDYGPQKFVFEDRRKAPLGANMAVRRDFFDRIGRFDPRLGRRGNSLLGQEQAEFFARARDAGATGMYVPAMLVHHHVPAARLTKSYFRRWWFWKGVARARLDAMHNVTELGLDLTTVPHIAGVPRFMWGLIARAVRDLARAWLRRDVRDSVRHQMSLCFAVGYVRSRWARAGSRISSSRVEKINDVVVLSG